MLELLKLYNQKFLGHEQNKNFVMNPACLVEAPLWQDPILTELDDNTALDEIEQYAGQFKKFNNVVVIGIGGSSLGAKTLVTALKSTHPHKPKLHFIDNIDPISLQEFLAQLQPQTTGFIVVSKSGETIETMAQFLLCHKWLGQEPAHDHMMVITKKQNSSLYQLAARFNLPILHHHSDIGGRFAVLTAVGLLPAAIVGIDIRSIVKGAQICRDHLKQQNTESLPFLASQFSRAAETSDQQTIHVFMPYCDRLQPLGLWFRQLWAESLGKNGHGSTPISALGPVDQHSQLQLWLDGPQDKYFTFITVENQMDQVQIPIPENMPQLQYLAGNTISDVVKAEQQATIATLAKQNKNIMVLNLTKLDEKTMGALLLQQMLEVILNAHDLGINPYGQPAVEQGKVLTRQYLNKSIHDKSA